MTTLFPPFTPTPTKVVPVFKGWDLDKALTTLGFHEEPLPRELWDDRHGDSWIDALRINPELRRPGYVYLHELAHLVLGHSQESLALMNKYGAFAQYQNTALEARHEAEAERVAIALADEFEVSFNREGARQHMVSRLNQLGQTHFTPDQAQRILRATQTIRKAGR